MHHGRKVRCKIRTKTHKTVQTQNNVFVKPNEHSSSLLEYSAMAIKCTFKNNKRSNTSFSVQNITTEAILKIATDITYLFPRARIRKKYPKKLYTPSTK